MQGIENEVLRIHRPKDGEPEQCLSGGSSARQQQR